MPEADRLPAGSFTPPKRELRIDQPEVQSGLRALDDGELYARHVDGCKRSFAVLFERHNERLVGWLSSRFRFTRSTAEEVAQETWLRADRGAFADGFARFLTVAAKDLAREHIRRSTRRLAILTAHVSQEWRLTTESQTVSEDAASALRASIEQLPADLRQAIKLVFFDCLTVRQAASVAKCAVSTMIARLDEAKSRIKSSLS